MKVFIGVFIGAILLITVFMCICIINKEFFNSRYLNNILYSGVCDDQIPDGWEIVENDDGLWAVHYISYDGIYLQESLWGIREMYITIAEPSLFFTECKARNYLKAYLKEQEPKMVFH